MKIARHAQIIKLINQYDIETQGGAGKEAGGERLCRNAGDDFEGYPPAEDSQKYQKRTAEAAMRGPPEHAPSEVGSRYARVLKDAYISVDLAKNILVIKTVSGMAMAAAAAFDEMNWNEIVGCIGGDDTILCVARDDDAALVAAERLKKMVDGMEETGEEF